jgi:hypothetical protein
MRLFFALLAMSAGALAVAGSCTSTPAQETLCNPGDNVFCRCRGGDPGTKPCQADGQSFGQCESAWGSCDEIPQGGNGTGAGSGAGGEAPPPPPGELLGTCSSDEDCGGAPMICPMGYCTKPCSSYEECVPPAPAAPGDCVQLGGGPICMPYCIEQGDCAAFGADSVCSWTDQSLPGCSIVVCANWGPPAFPPDGYPYPGSDQCSCYESCDSDTMCNLGLPSTSRVCHAGACVEGCCHQASDCPSMTPQCSAPSPNELGGCSQSGNPGEACPGEPVTIAVADGQVDVMGDTSVLTAGSYTGTGACNYSAGTSTPEWIYHVIPAESGTLTMLLQPVSSFDSVLYVRSGSCQSGSQIVCDDEPGDGASEIAEVPVTANQPIWIFVDGYDGSTGMFELSLSL